MGTREQDEKKFGAWIALPGGGRLYRLEIAGRFGWRACYFKEVDSNEITVRFWQEIYDNQDALVEIHEKYPLDKALPKKWCSRKRQANTGSAGALDRIACAARSISIF